jgi:hypothetical protein
MRAGYVVPSQNETGEVMLTTTLLLTGQLALATLSLLQAESTDFGDLGKTLLVGFVLAVAAGVAFTLVRLRLREKKRWQLA